MKTFVSLENLEVYQLAKELSTIGWKIFSALSWEMKKVCGFQFIDSTDSIGANIVEGYYRFHYLDRIRFYYTSRGSLAEAKEHWIERIRERTVIDESFYQEYKTCAEKLHIKLNNLIRSSYNAKKTYENRNKSEQIS